MPTKERKSLGEALWPTIIDKVTAKKTSRHGVWAAGFVSVATAIMARFGQIVSRAPFIDAILFAIIAFGIYRMSKIAAVAGLVLFIVVRIDTWIEHGMKNPIITILIALYFINGVRGTFAYHKFAE